MLLSFLLGPGPVASVVPKTMVLMAVNWPAVGAPVAVMAALVGAACATGRAERRNMVTPGTSLYWFAHEAGPQWRRIATEYVPRKVLPAEFAHWLHRRGLTPQAVDLLMSESTCWTAARGWNGLRPDDWSRWRAWSGWNQWLRLVGNDERLVVACLRAGFTRREVARLLETGTFDPAAVRTLSALM